MPETRNCPACGAAIPSGFPEGLCPKCMLQAGFESQPPVDPAHMPTQRSPVASTGFVPPEPAELAARFPQLEILELLGKGGMGAVYKARQPGLDRLVAVKILPPDVSHDPAFAERFTREARALARLSHPNIVAVHDFGQAPAPLAPTGRGAGGEGPLFYFVMEYVDGANLRQAIHAGGMTPKDALAIVPQICDALQFAHDEGIVHRDIKPENILIDKRGRVKIADFGLAKLLGQDQADHSLTATHQVMGTLRYMAPEQMEGSKLVDHRADIYSLGVVFYELLTHELPVGRFAPPSKKVQIDVRLDEVVLRALEKEPEQRYQHASDVKTDVEAVASGKDATARGNRAEGNHATVEERIVEPIRFPRWLLFSPLDFLRAVVLENVTAAAVAMTFVIAATKGICELAQRPSPLDVVAVPVAALAALATGVLLVAHQFRRPIGSRAALPELFIAVLAACAGSLPWTAVFSPIAGWLFWQGAVFASLNFALSLFLLIAGNSLPRTRSIAILLVGLFGFTLVMWFDIGPVGVIGSDFLATITRKPGLPGEFIAAAIALLAMIAGALQLRNQMNAGDNAETSPPPQPSNEPRFSRFAMWSTILAVLSVLAFVGIVFVGTVVFDHLFVVYEHARVKPLGVSIAEWLLGTVGVLAGLGAVLCGAAAVAEIKRSGGRLYGLPLAAGAMLCDPLLVLGSITFWLTHLTLIAVWTNWPGPVATLQSPVAPPPKSFPGEVFSVFDAIAALLVCFFAGRKAWRAIVGPPTAQGR